MGGAAHNKPGQYNKVIAAWDPGMAPYQHERFWVNREGMHSFASEVDRHAAL